MNRIRCIYLNNGISVNGFSDHTESKSNYIDSARNARDEGALLILAFDFSSSEPAHDADIEAIRQICREAVLPVIGAGNVKRAEDVKKLLYAGCAKAVLNFSRESNILLLEEVSKRFGKNKIAVYLPSEDVFERNRTLLEQYADILVCESDLAGKLKSKTESGILAIDPKGGNHAAIHFPLGLESEFSWSEMKLNEQGLLPVIAQDARTDEVLMLAYMNQEAFEETLRSRRMTYWSRSRNELWKKGETSGHFQFVQSLRIDCDNDTLLAKVIQIGAACHTGNPSCFYRELTSDSADIKNASHVLEDVYQIITDRKQNPKEGSYTNYLFEKGLDKILKKLGEEAVEIIIAAKNPDPQESVYEISDFLYHVMVLMAEKGISWESVLLELANR